jgi:hypothetical protein
MCNEAIDNKYKLYDNVVSTIMTNVLVERERCGKFIVYDFDQTDDANRLFFNITAIAADLNREKIYLDMPLLDFIFFWKKRRKNRKNLRWLNPIQEKKLPDENKTSVYMIMDFICKELNINYLLYKEINNKYYGWVD